MSQFRLPASFLKKPDGVKDLPLHSLSSPSLYGISHSGPLILNDATIKPCLFGVNEIEGVDVSGWTYCTRTVNVNEHNSALVKKMGLNIVTEGELNDDEPVGPVKRYYHNKQSSFFKTLAQLSETAPILFSSFSYIIDVIVVAKMGVEMTKSKTSNDVLYFGNIAIGDNTGLALLKTINQEVLTLYDNVCVGDRLILTVGNYKNSVDDYVMFPAFEPHFLPLSIKLSFYHVKRGFKILRDDNKLHFVPEFLAPSSNLLTPSDILRSVDNATILEHMDILGIVTYASRKWRERRDDININVHNEENYSQKVNMTLPLYTIVQYIEIIDNSNKPISIRINFTEEQIRKEINFVPGAAIVLTLCQPSKWGEKGIGPLVETSKFTQIYMNMDIKYYLHTLPLSLHSSMKEKSSEIVSSSVSYKIFKSKDVSWTVGGSFSSPIRDESKFLAHYKTKKSKLILPLIRRENLFHVFKGHILRVMVVRKEWGSDEWEWTNRLLTSRASRRNIPSHCSDELHDGVPLSEGSCSYWYAFRRLLPTPNVAEFPDRTSRDTSRVFYNEHVASLYNKYTLASNMPIPSLQALIDLKKLKAVDSYPYYILDVLNLDEENLKLKRKFFLWKSCQGLSFNDMEKKLEELRENILVFSTQIYRRESYNLQHYMGYELIIDDFMKYS